jgi:hypothetical protein
MHCVDPDGQALTLSIVSQPTRGRLSGLLSSSQSVYYVPNYTTASTTDSFTYQASDGAATSNIATVSIKIN